MFSIDFEESDANLLHSIIFGCGSSSISLNALLNTACTLGHTPFSFAQFDSGIAKLIVAGLVEFDGTRITPTAEALDVADRLCGSDADSGRLLEGIMLYLESYSSSTADTLPSFTTGVISASEFDSAFC